MRTRLLAALLGLAVVMPAITWGGMAGLRVVVLLAAWVCCSEFAAMAFPERSRLYAVWLGLWVLGLACASWFAPVQWGVFGIALGVMASMSYWVFWRPESLSEGVRDLGYLTLGVVWISLLLFLPALRSLDFGLEWVWFALVVSWSSDSGAYLVGRTVGRRPLHASISPKKTWEGFFGGLLAAGLCAMLMGHYMLPHLLTGPLFVLGAILAVAGVVGDLMESFFKRSFGVKDSGWIMPGHGGLLDRVDSVLFVAPWVYGYALWQGG